MDAKRADEDGDGGQAGAEADLRAAVEAVMARLAGGERGAVWELHDLAETNWRMLELRLRTFRWGRGAILIEVLG